MRRFEDLAVGEEVDCGETTADREEMIQFAKRYDPQPFHTDPELASRSPFGGIVASGWYTAALCMRLVVGGYLTEIATTGARGVDRLRWPAPVQPGDRLGVTVRIEDTSVETAERGLATLAVTGTRVDGDEEATVLSLFGLVLVRRR